MYCQRNAAVTRIGGPADPMSGGQTSTAVHDGFATVRRPHHYVGLKRRRATAAAVMGLAHLEPVTEHVGDEQQQQQQLQPYVRPKSSYGTARPPLPSDVPWWEIATRRRPKSCADFGATAKNDKVTFAAVSSKIYKFNSRIALLIF